MEDHTPITPTELRALPIFGVTALVLSSSPVLFVAFIVAIFVPVAKLFPKPVALIALLGPSCLGSLAPLVGVGFGFVSLARREVKDYLAIAGIVIGILFALAMLLIDVFTLLFSLFMLYISTYPVP